MEKNTKHRLIDNIFYDNYNDESKESTSDGLMKLKRLKTQAKAELRRERYSRFKEIITTIKEGLNNNIENYREVFKIILDKPQYNQVQTLFKNLNEVSEEDEKSMLMDAKFLELLDELERDLENFDKD